MYDDFLFSVGNIAYIYNYARTATGSSTAGTAGEVFFAIYQSQVLVLFLLCLPDIVKRLYSETDRGSFSERNEEVAFAFIDSL